MARCEQTTNLEVHHIVRANGNSLDNAQVLCEPCHEATPDYGKHGTPAKDFDKPTIIAARLNAENRCQCTNITRGCHQNPALGGLLDLLLRRSK